MGYLDSLDQTVFASAARTTTVTSSDIAVSARSVTVVLDATVNAGSAGSVTVTINGKDQASGKYYLLLAGAAVTTVSTNRYRISPHLTASANAVAADIVPATLQIIVTANNANPVAYSVGLSTSV